MCKEDFALNNLQWLICHKTKTKPNQTKPKPSFYQSILFTCHIPILICSFPVLFVYLGTYTSVHFSFI